MDQKTRFAQLGKSALQYAVQHYLARYPTITLQEVELVTKLVSSPTFLHSLQPASAEQFGQDCIKSGISPIQSQVETTIGPRIEAFLGLCSAVNENWKPSQQVENRSFNHQDPLNPLLKVTMDPTKTENLEVAGLDLFSSLSDEALLKGSSFAKTAPNCTPGPPGPPGTPQSQAGPSEFDLVDGDTWYSQQK